MPADLIILAAIVIFILLRLRSVLGQKPGEHNPGPLRDANPERERVVLAPREIAASDREMLEEDLAADDAKWSEGLKSGIEAIRKQDKNFTMSDFIAGAKVAYDMVHEAFAKDDRETLKSLMNKDTFALFKTEMENTALQAEKSVATLVAINKTEPQEAVVEQNKARITVHFLSEQMQSRRTKDNQLVQGGTSAIQQVEDVWTFERDLRSSNPNWTLIDT